MKQRIIDGMKMCLRCKRSKPVNEFNKRTGSPTGRNASCKLCLRSTIKQICPQCNNEFNPLQVGQVCCSLSCAAIRQRTGTGLKRNLRRRARQYTQELVDEGKLQRPNCCSNCGKAARIEAHHVNYNDSLHVLWLCVSCHRFLHHRGMKFLNTKEVEIKCQN